jgi:hypothetical protein
VTDTDTDLFGRPTRGAFPKVEELDGRLLLIMPSKIEYKIKGQFGEQDRVTADVIVLDDPDEPNGIREIEDMYISQGGLVPMLARCLKPGAKHPYVLGRLDMFPSKVTREEAEKHPEGIRGVLADWLKKGGKGNKPQFSWGLSDFTDDEANKARAYLASRDQFSAANA